MPVDLSGIQGGRMARKNRDQKYGPGLAVGWLPGKIEAFTRRERCGSRVAKSCAKRRNPGTASTYALLRGRIVRSRTCVRMLDICMPFSCDTKGKISAINASFIN